MKQNSDGNYENVYEYRNDVWQKKIKLPQGKLMNNKILWLDTETTGLSPKKNGLREIGYIIIIDNIEVEKGVLRIDPRTYEKDIEIDPQALEISGTTIDNFDTHDDSAFAFDRFLPILDKYVNKEDKNDFFTLAGYNTKFDNDFLKSWFWDNQCGEEYNNYIHYKLLDVFSLVIILRTLGLIETENDRLETICNYFDIPIAAHNALDDIKATKNLYELIVSRYFNFEISDLNQTIHMKTYKDTVPTLRELEFAVRDYILKVFEEKLDGTWFFDVKYYGEYNNKRLAVIYSNENSARPIYNKTNENADELIKDAYKFFNEVEINKEKNT